jgi:murein DD-endopeptidase MepM/ murein hydrolase activator NlpD
LKSDFAPADGFDFAVGNEEGAGSYNDRSTGRSYSGWYIATHFTDKYSYGLHPGEDWSGSGPPESDLGQDVHVVANGRVAFADFCGRLWGNVIMVDHVFYENSEKKTIRSVYAHLNEIKVRSGQVLNRRQVIGTVGQDPDKLFAPHLHLEMRSDLTLGPTYWPSSNGKNIDWIKEHYAEPSAFIKSHRRIPLPQREATLILVDQNSFKMRLYQQGELQGEYNVSFGQGMGAKRVEGDNRTPTGMYFVIQKHQGRFDGAYGAYYGGYWIKLNYPNGFDALRGKLEGLITPEQAATIARRWQERAPTLENTKLGSGIGFHGWAREWSDEGPRRLSWGCVVMHLRHQQGLRSNPARKYGRDLLSRLLFRNGRRRNRRRSHLDAHIVRHVFSSQFDQPIDYGL